MLRQLGFVFLSAAMFLALIVFLDVIDAPFWLHIAVLFAFGIVWFRYRYRAIAEIRRSKDR